MSFNHLQYHFMKSLVILGLFLKISHERVWKRKVLAALSARLLHPWNSPGKNTGVGYHFPFNGSSQSMHQTQISHIGGEVFTIWATREARLRVYVSVFSYIENDPNLCSFLANNLYSKKYCRVLSLLII